MYPRLSDLLYDLLGINIPLPAQTYGFFVALAFITGSVILFFELKRKEQNGTLTPIKQQIERGKPPKIMDVLLSVIGGFVIGYKLVAAVFNYDSFVENPQDFLLSTDGHLFGGIAFAGLFAYLKYMEAQKAKKEKPGIETKTIHPKDISGNILVVASVFGILGAKLFHILENIPELMKDPAGIIFSFSGLTFFGGMICGSIAVLIYARRYNIGVFHLVDSGAPALALAYGVGRIGCQLSGDGCWGVPNTAPKPDWMGFLPDWMWSFKFPHNVINSGVRIPDCGGSHCMMLSEGVFPTSFYETVMMTTIFLILWSVRKRINTQGMLFSLFLLLIGIERFFIEKIRVNNTFDFLGMKITQAEVISTVLIILGITGMILLYKYKNSIKTYTDKKTEIIKST